jgi:hypothetical protein
VAIIAEAEKEETKASVASLKNNEKSNSRKKTKLCEIEKNNIT